MQEEVVGDGVVEEQAVVQNMSLLQLEGDEQVVAVAWTNSMDQELQMNFESVDGSDDVGADVDDTLPSILFQEDQWN